MKNLLYAKIVAISNEEYLVCVNCAQRRFYHDNFCLLYT